MFWAHHDDNIFRSWPQVSGPMSSAKEVPMKKIRVRDSNQTNDEFEEFFIVEDETESPDESNETDEFLEFCGTKSNTRDNNIVSGDVQWHNNCSQVSDFGWVYFTLFFRLDQRIRTQKSSQTSKFWFFCHKVQERCKICAGLLCFTYSWLPGHQIPGIKNTWSLKRNFLSFFQGWEKVKVKWVSFAFLSFFMDAKISPYLTVESLSKVMAKAKVNRSLELS